MSLLWSHHLNDTELDPFFNSAACFPAFSAPFPGSTFLLFHSSYQLWTYCLLLFTSVSFSSKSVPREALFALAHWYSPCPTCRHDPKDVEFRGVTLPTGRDESLIIRLFYSSGFAFWKKKNHVSSYTIVPKLDIQNGWRWCPRPPGR